MLCLYFPSVYFCCSIHESETIIRGSVFLLQVYRLCHPCQVKYDFIGHLETLEEDTERLLKILKVDHLLHFPSGAHNLTSTSWERDWFAQIPIATRKELYKLYEPDFEMFGYAKPDGLLQQELD